MKTYYIELLGRCRFNGARDVLDHWMDAHDLTLVEHTVQRACNQWRCHAQVFSCQPWHMVASLHPHTL